MKLENSVVYVIYCPDYYGPPEYAFQSKGEAQAYAESVSDEDETWLLAKLEIVRFKPAELMPTRWSESATSTTSELGGMK